MKKLLVPSVIVLSLVIGISTYILYKQQQEKLNFEKTKWEQEHAKKEENTKEEKTDKTKKDTSTPAIQPTSKNPPPRQDAGFEQKQECQKYKSGIELELQEEEQKQLVLYSDVSIELDKIFYSEMKNTCMYTAIEFGFGHDGKIHKSYWLVDILSNDKTVYGRPYELNSPEWQRAYQDFRNHVNALESPVN